MKNYTPSDHENSSFLSFCTVIRSESFCKNIVVRKMTKYFGKSYIGSRTPSEFDLIAWWTDRYCNSFQVAKGCANIKMCQTAEKSCRKAKETRTGDCDVTCCTADLCNAGSKGSSSLASRALLLILCIVHRLSQYWYNKQKNIKSTVRIT